MPYIHSFGDPASRIWVICPRPYPSDEKRGHIFSGGLGHVFNVMLEEVGLEMKDFYICSLHPDTDDPKAYSTAVDNGLQAYKPPFVLMLNEVGLRYFKDLLPREKDENFRKQLNKYVGSLLVCDKFQWPHYVMPLHGPDRLTQNWLERNVTTYIDLQKLRDELQYWKTTGTVQPLRQRQLFFHNFDFGDLLSHFERFQRAAYLSVDIETVYPKAKSAFLPHPGYPITIGIAPSSDLGISFNLFRDDPRETRILWRELDSLLSKAQIIGQNFFNFDSFFINMLGFSLQKLNFHDTLLRHHILWPELPHKLQFLTRQYTREPYYKDEGKHWSMKHLNSLRRYNCLDVCTTYEVFEAQEEEFKDRPHLKGKAA